MSSTGSKQLAEKACRFLTASTDPFHAVHTSIQLLEAAGFTRLLSHNSASATKPWDLAPGGKYYYTVQNSTLVAFTVGQQYSTSKAGAFHLIGGHTDSPNLRIKPRSKLHPHKHGVVQLGVECYGGGLWHTWLDRDLSVSGKVLVRQSDSNKVEPKLVNLERPVARVSNLCIHLQSAEDRKALTINKEDHTKPIVASFDKNTDLEEAVQEQINTTSDPWLAHHEPLLLQRIAEQLQIDITDIADFDLSLYDTQPAQLGGFHDEFLYAGRLDNLATVFCAVTALSQHAVENDPDIAMICCFDHEEVGSKSGNGAGSPVMQQAIQRVSAALGVTTGSPDYHTALSKSFCLSIDQAHAIHPNYAHKHEAQHAPVMNGGIVIKTNSNQRYTTNSLTAFVLRELGRKLQIPMQEFCVRNDCPCGSTIGPTIASLTGIRTVDAGMPQLSMHSCREVMGVQDLEYGVQLFAGFWEKFREIDDSVQDPILES